MLSGKSISKKYTDTLILKNVDFKLGNGRKVGLVGRNGSGKTTLFKLIMGEEELSDGYIDRENETLSYIPQELIFSEDTVANFLKTTLSHSWEFYKIEELVDKVKFDNFNPSQKILSLSEGQKMKLKLIGTMLQNPTVLLIDEPTNHLDIEGIMWFENYLKSLKISVLMISHDREFLNNAVDEIWEIEKNQLFRFVGNYDRYKEEKLRLVNKWDEEYVRFLKKKKSLETLLENVRKIKDAKKRGKAVGAAKKRIEREIEGENKVEKYEVHKVKGLGLESSTPQGKLMVRFENVSKTYGEAGTSEDVGREQDHTPVFSDLDFEIRGGEKIWLFGPNGSGKTTIVKLIVNEEKPTQGHIKIGDNISVGYFSQVQTDLEFNESLIDYFVKETGVYYGDAYSPLGRFLFDKDTIKKKIWQLSPGERSRFKLAIFANKKYDLLILDEPDNHLDIVTKEVLEEALREFKGALLLVSHDRYFIERVGIERMLNLKDGILSYIR